MRSSLQQSLLNGIQEQDDPSKMRPQAKATSLYGHIDFTWILLFRERRCWKIIHLGSRLICILLQMEALRENDDNHDLDTSDPQPGLA